MFVWNDAGRWWIFFWWNVGKLLEVNETTSLTLECRAFTVRFFTRDRSSLRQRMTFYLRSSHLEVEILNHVDLTPRFLDASTMTLMFFVLMVDILAFDQIPECCHWAFVLFAIQVGIQSDTEERCDYDFFHDQNHMNHKNDYSLDKFGIFLYINYIYIDPSRCKKSDEALIFESRLCKLRSLKWFFSPFLHPSNFGLFKGMTRL